MLEKSGLTERLSLVQRLQYQRLARTGSYTNKIQLRHQIERDWLEFLFAFAFFYISFKAFHTTWNYITFCLFPSQEHNMPGSHTVAVLTTLALIIASSWKLFSLCLPRIQKYQKLMYLWKFRKKNQRGVVLGFQIQEQLYSCSFLSVIL